MDVGTGSVGGLRGKGLGAMVRQEMEVLTALRSGGQ